MNGDSLLQTVDSLILSTSGWRGVFAKNTEEESADPEISEEHQIIVACAAMVFAEYVNKQKSDPVILVGRDTRPTGEAIANAILRIFSAESVRFRYAGITAAPEIMAAVRNGCADAFVYISASHNPIGHNGLKFGLNDGGVLPGTETQIVIQQFRKKIAEPESLSHIFKQIRTIDYSINLVQVDRELIKRETLRAYQSFTGEVIGNIVDALRTGLKQFPVGVVADFNGSARGHSIDRNFFSSLGIQYEYINPDHIVHTIVPEGEALEPARLFLEEMHRKNPDFVIGYVPDCDGDRGNLVIWDGKSRILETQEVFALACVAELAQLVWTNAGGKNAVVVNDPTSLRIDRIAEAFGAELFRAEVGEANVVALSRHLREECGYTVRILGEGSAGGVITYPSSVRDPLDTIAAVLKLLTIRNYSGKKGLFAIWCELTNRLYRDDFTLADVIASLPAFVTTPAYTPDAKVQIHTNDHSLLKSRYQKIFEQEWENRKHDFENRYGIMTWTASAFCGQEEKKQIRDFGEAGRGGLKIVFYNQHTRAVASLWMRGSGTEPVFRIMADVEGAGCAFERELIAWQRDMLIRADKKTG
ncbi:phosphoglucomutase [Spirochaetia bacterium]|nr:phosphoglucomutase [Spirochaetia bacterium]GHU35174.1 phosphoglucomutase [Spirochaetia bacterium]